jgi:hypothetical protein
VAGKREEARLRKPEAEQARTRMPRRAILVIK